MSTRAFGFVVATVLVLLNVPGETDGIVRLHGWPFTYLIRAYRTPVDPPGMIVERVHRVPPIWSISDDVREFRLLLLLVDILVAVLTTLGACVLFQLCQRRLTARFGLRTLALMVVVIAGALSWLTARTTAIRRQAPAISQIESLDGYVDYDTCLPEWLDNVLPSRIGRLFSDVTSVDLGYTNVSDRELKGISVFTRLRSLDLTSTKTSDAGMIHIRDLTKLTWLSLDDSSITDDGLEYVSGLRELECLGLAKTLIQGQGLRHISDCQRLEIVDLRHSRLTDDGLMQLAGLPGLWRVYTADTEVTEEGAERFRAASCNGVYVDYIDEDGDFLEVFGDDSEC